MLIELKARKTALLGIVLLWALTSNVLANQLQDISFSALPGNRVEIVLTTSEPVGDPDSFTTDNPARIAIDLVNTTSALSTKVTPVAIGMARSVTAIEAGDRTRVVINLLEQVPEYPDDADKPVIRTVDPNAGAIYTALLGDYADPADGQPVLERLLNHFDRGDHIRDEAGYTSLARSVFPRVEVSYRRDLLRFPYTHFIMRCAVAARQSS